MLEMKFGKLAHMAGVRLLGLSSVRKTEMASKTRILNEESDLVW